MPRCSMRARVRGCCELYKAPEVKRELIGMAVTAALENTTDAERAGLHKAEGMPAVDWDELVGMFTR
jgi:hypothetical protein